MYESHYGKGMKKGSEDGYVVPGSPDARAKAYKRDMYDSMEGMSGYGKKIPTKKNRTATGEPNTSIQGGADNKVGESVKGTGRTHKTSYAAANLENSVTENDAYDYGKGRMKKRK